LERLPSGAPDYHVTRTYLEFMLDLPWNVATEDNLDLAHARQVLDDYESGAVDAVYLVYAQFISTLRQQPRSVQLLPVQPPEESEATGPWSYEPDNPQAVLSQLLPAYVEFTVYQAMLEAIASEHSARMIAMSNATDNALELIKDYTLLAHKYRQAEIHKEISRISGEAKALRRSVVAQAQRSKAAVKKQTTGVTPDRLPVNSFRTLLASLEILARNTIISAINPNYPLTMVTPSTPVQQKAFDLLGLAV